MSTFTCRYTCIVYIYIYLFIYDILHIYGTMFVTYYICTRSQNVLQQALDDSILDESQDGDVI